jgi:putative hemolysin
LDEPPGFSLLNIFPDQSWIYLFLILFVVCSAWTSAVEAAFFSLTNDDLERLKTSNDEREKATARLLVDPRLLLTVLTTCKYFMIVGVAIISIAAVAYQTTVNDIPASSVTSGVLLLTVFFALAGVILPKIYGTSRYLSVSRANSNMVKRISAILKPVVRPLLKTSYRMEKQLDARTEQKSIQHLTQALKLAAIENDPIEGEKEILDGIVNFGILTVKQVMKPRSEISYTDATLNFHELLEFIKKSGFSRVPVCQGGLDKVQGVLYIKDLLPFLEEGKGFTWQRLLRPGYFVPESKKIDSLLKDFQEKRVHLALVVNHLGHTTGLISLEDIIEEIIGDINDEFDEVGARYQKINNREYLFDGKTSLHEFCKVLDVDPDIFDPIKGINESLGVVLTEVNEKLPASGDAIIIEPFTFVIESVHNMRIGKIKVLIHEQKEH